MKVTLFDAELEDVARAAELVRSYIDGGFADEDRKAHRNCVIFAPKIAAADNWQASVWGDRAHIRIAFFHYEKEGQTDG